MSVKQIFLMNLKEMIADRNISFTKFSQDIGINRRTMSRWYFDRAPSTKSVVRIADYFHCSIDYLLNKTDDPSFNISDEPVTFFERYTLMKKLNGLNDNKISMLCNIRSSTIVYWKNGAIPDFEIIASLSDILGCSFDYLIGRSKC